MIQKKPGQYDFRCKCGKYLFAGKGAEEITIRCRGCGDYVTINFTSGNSFVDRVVKK